MKLAADTNILFTFFWKHSLLRTILTEKHLQLISPEYALNEILCYKEEIKKKAKLSRDYLLILKRTSATARRFRNH